MANTEGLINKFTVIKNEDVLALPKGHLWMERLKNICEVVETMKASKYRTSHREAGTDHFHNPTPKAYLVINTDEPYADEVIEIMKRHGHWG